MILDFEWTSLGLISHSLQYHVISLSLQLSVPVPNWNHVIILISFLYSYSKTDHSGSWTISSNLNITSFQTYSIQLITKAEGSSSQLKRKNPRDIQERAKKLSLVEADQLKLSRRMASHFTYMMAMAWKIYVLCKTPIDGANFTDFNYEEVNLLFWILKINICK